MSPLPLHNIFKYSQTQFAHTEMEITQEDDNEGDIYVLSWCIFLFTLDAHIRHNFTGDFLPANSIFQLIQLGNE